MLHSSWSFICSCVLKTSYCSRCLSWEQCVTWEHTPLGHQDITCTRIRAPVSNLPSPNSPTTKFVESGRKPKNQEENHTYRSRDRDSNTTLTHGTGTSAICYVLQAELYSIKSVYTLGGLSPYADYTLSWMKLSMIWPDPTSTSDVSSKQHILIFVPAWHRCVLCEQVLIHTLSQCQRSDFNQTCSVVWNLKHILAFNLTCSHVLTYVLSGIILTLSFLVCAALPCFPWYRFIISL